MKLITASLAVGFAAGVIVTIITYSLHWLP